MSTVPIIRKFVETFKRTTQKNFTKNRRRKLRPNKNVSIMRACPYNAYLSFHINTYQVLHVWKKNLIKCNSKGLNSSSMLYLSIHKHSCAWMGTSMYLFCEIHEYHKVLWCEHNKWPKRGMIFHISFLALHCLYTMRSKRRFFCLCHNNLDIVFC